MHAVVMTDNGAPEVLRYQTLTDPTPTPTQVVVRVRACGVCGHDIADRSGLTRVRGGVVLGHEIAGEIVATGSAVRGFGVGDRVASKQHHTCLDCAACTSGDELGCDQARFVYGGIRRVRRSRTRHADRDSGRGEHAAGRRDGLCGR